MLVPDIPLPKTYTQRCVSCGFVNPVGDDLFYGPETDVAEEVGGSSETDVFDFSQPTQYHEEIHLANEQLSPDSTDDWMNRLDSVKPMEIKLDLPAEEEPSKIGSSRTPSATSAGMTLDQLRPHLENLRLDLQKEFGLKMAELELKFHELSRQKVEPSPKPPVAAPQEQQAVVSVGEVLLCTQVPAITESILKTLTEHGFKVHHVASAGDAIRFIQELAFQVIIMDQRFVQASPEGQNLLNSIKQIALPIRRHQSVVLLTPRLETGESQVFYQWGVDLNVLLEEAPVVGKLTAELLQLKAAMQKAYLQSDLDTDRVMV